MIFSTRSTYGLRSMINLAKRESAESIPLVKIAKQEKISLKYLERLFSNLKKAKLVKAAKGAKGGYGLARDAKRINVYDIIKALEGEFNPFHCSDGKGKTYCNIRCNCEVTYVLSRVEQAIDSALKDIKLSRLL